ncbi:MAG: FecR domain-containing protein [Alphaproteobacteria bacterium]|nr:FecR domain-containing protein [Alphaproteobacteria bacterium]MBU1513101.1 FecR domain-containing protein [Alphaproteobacteria bacterium]MBU2095209.1 FecR domain-containing protein [Alphaproteobacteria bacterium]MBU2150632.1 FecR domain-containing protein [Alphaproteobacteria bacterium]MBU2306109.1 FecR domain-containing protein [Alphaproteobacteria bacterium]
MAKETADDIDEAAASWAARADRGLSVVETAELDAWLRGDIRRSGAYARMTWALMSTERPEADAGVGARASQRMTRRQWMAGGGAIAASLAGAGVYLNAVRPVAYSTRKGEKKVVSLDDGSVMTLNTNTRVEVRYAKDRRLIRLVEGEALFDVAKDRDRPFIVSARNAEVRAVGTSFTVSNVDSAPVEVLVREGIVDVTRANLAQQAPTRLKANSRAILARDTGAVAVAHVDDTELGSDLAWKDGRIVFQGETLAAAAAKFARYSDIGIVIVDPDLGAEKVAGVFDANDPVGFAKSVALSLNAKAEIRADVVRLAR